MVVDQRVNLDHQLPSFGQRRHGALIILIGQRHSPGQGNNAYIFIGVGLGIVSTAARRVSDARFIQAARSLTFLIRESELDEGRVYPAHSRIHEVSRTIAVAMAEEVVSGGVKMG